MNNSITDNHPFVEVKNVQSFCCQKVYGAANLFVNLIFIFSLVSEMINKRDTLIDD